MSQISTPKPEGLPKQILALDLSKFNTIGRFFDSKTCKHSPVNANADHHYLKTVFKKHYIDLLVMESYGPSGWIGNLAQSLALKTLGCSANEEACKRSNSIWQSQKLEAIATTASRVARWPSRPVQLQPKDQDADQSHPNSHPNHGERPRRGSDEVTYHERIPCKSTKPRQQKAPPLHNPRTS